MTVVRRWLASPLFHLVAEFILFLLLVSLAVFLVSFIPTTEQEPLARVASALAALFTLVLAWKFIERAPAHTLGLVSPQSGRKIVTSFGLGALLLSVVVGLLALAGWYRIVSIDFSFPTLGAVALLFLVLLCAAFLEEVLFRMIIFRQLEKILGSWVALLISALLFGFAHIINPGATVVSSLNIAIEAGILIALLYMLTRDLWAIAAFHLAWNFFEGPVYGTQVSGRGFASIINSATSGPVLWTGGEFGPEAGLVALCICTLAALICLYLVIRQGQVRIPLWQQRLWRRDAREPVVVKAPAQLEDPS